MSLLDAGKATRAEAEGSVDPATGRWSVGLRVPDLGPQSAEITAVCLARVGAASPYARHKAAAFTVESPPSGATTTTTAPAPPSTGGGTTTPPATAKPQPSTLPPTPLAVAIVAEPTYTG